MRAAVSIVVVINVTERQKRFCEYYCTNAKGNAQRAAEMAGYSPNYARAKSYALLQCEDIKAYISEIKSKLKKSDNEGEADIDEIKLFWASVMRDDSVRTSERLKASELLAKCKGGFNDGW